MPEQSIDVNLLLQKYRDLTQRYRELQQRYTDLQKKTTDYRVEVDKRLREGDKALAEIQAAYKRMMEFLEQPSYQYAYFLFLRDSTKRLIDVSAGGGRMAIVCRPEIDLESLKPGQLLMIGQSVHGPFVYAALPEFDQTGSEATVEEVISGGRVRIETRHGDKVIAGLAGNASVGKLEAGDKVLFSPNGLVLEKLPQRKKSSFVFEEIPDLTYDDIGGQDAAIGELRDNLELPLLAIQDFAAYKAKRPPGLILWGPPGNGKTTAVKVVANMLRKLVPDRPIDILLMRGPEAYTMWLGVTEEKMREPFDLARIKAKEGGLVLFLFDEMDAVVPIRGTRVGGSGVAETVVTQLNALLDGVEEFPNLMLIGTTNRPDNIDHSLTRPGRLMPIEFPQPNQEGFRRIFRIHLGGDFPIHEKYLNPAHPEFDKQRYRGFSESRQLVIEYWIERLLLRIFGDADLERQEIVTIEYEDGARERQTFYMKDIVSGSHVADMVSKAKIIAIKNDRIQGKRCGVRLGYLFQALEKLFREGQALPSRTHPQEWARILNLPISRPFHIVPKGEKTFPALRGSSVTG